MCSMSWGCHAAMCQNKLDTVPASYGQSGMGQMMGGGQTAQHRGVLACCGVGEKKSIFQNPTLLGC